VTKLKCGTRGAEAVVNEKINNTISVQFIIAAACGSEHGRRDVHWTARAMRADRAHRFCNSIAWVQRQKTHKYDV
jgi:hypothetical protein